MVDSIRICCFVTRHRNNMRLFYRYYILRRLLTVNVHRYFLLFYYFVLIVFYYYDRKKALRCLTAIFLFSALVYGTLYESVFNMTGITHIADKMLHDRNNAFRHDRFFQKGNLEFRE